MILKVWLFLDNFPTTLNTPSPWEMASELSGLSLMSFPCSFESINLVCPEFSIDSASLILGRQMSTIWEANPTLKPCCTLQTIQWKSSNVNLTSAKKFTDMLFWRSRMKRYTSQRSVGPWRRWRLYERGFTRWSRKAVSWSSYHSLLSFTNAAAVCDVV